MIPISIMQGRLLPPFEARFQAFPAMEWKEEFYKAQELGIYSIEWIYEEPHCEENPLTTDEGIAEISKLVSKTGVAVKSICADYYMTQNLIKNGSIVESNWNHLEWLLTQAKKLGIVYVILPFVDSSSLKNQKDQCALIDKLKTFLKKVESLGVEIHLEADLSPTEFEKVFKEVNHPLLKMNYDTGNSASLGYDPDEEFALMGQYLGSVHIKDRLLGGGTVRLGTGDTEFKKCFKWFKKLKFNRWFVLQVARNETYKELDSTREHMNFVHKELTVI